MSSVEVNNEEDLAKYENYHVNEKSRLSENNNILEDFNYKKYERKKRKK